jgi:group I intron endonuclease
LKASGIYEIRNVTNGKRYIGSSFDIKRRLGQHKSSLRTGRHDNEHLQRAFNKYGESGFVYAPLIVCERAELLYYETRLVQHYKATSAQHGYNKVVPDRSCLSEATKRKISEVRKAQWQSPEYRAKMIASQKGRVKSAEHKARMSADRKRWPITEAQLARLARGRTGRVWTDEAKRNLSIAMTIAKAAA